MKAKKYRGENEMKRRESEAIERVIIIERAAFAWLSR